MDKRTTAISARVKHEYIDYMRMNQIVVNKAINIGLRLICQQCQRDDYLCQKMVQGIANHEDVIESAIQSRQRRP